jgi:haloacetate dehalogenase
MTWQAPQIPGFDYRRVPVDGAELLVATGGAGPPVVLLHGFPQTHLAWRLVAPRLAESYRVICPDLLGYGRSDKPDAPVERYSKRAMAADIVAVMDDFGHERFAVIGHDRGALVAFRAALDHPDRVSHFGALDVVPQSEMWASLTGVAGVFAFHLYLLAQPEPLPERLIGAAPDEFFGHFLDSWAKMPGAIPGDIRTAYLDALRSPEAIHAVCQDYRAGAFVDPGHDDADRVNGNRLSMPSLALWQDPGERPLPFDPAEVWAAWAPDLRVQALSGGHFLAEELPVQAVCAVRDLLG